MANKTFKSITGREFRIASNKKERTFTIYTDGLKYRTIAMSREEFDSINDYYTGQDWANFLKTDSYYPVK